MSHTLIAFPNHITALIGVSYCRVGVRKVWVMFTGDRTYSCPRSALPLVLPEGNALAFELVRLRANGALVQA